MNIDTMIKMMIYAEKSSQCARILDLLGQNEKADEVLEYAKITQKAVDAAIANKLPPDVTETHIRRGYFVIQQYYAFSRFLRENRTILDNEKLSEERGTKPWLAVAEMEQPSTQWGAETSPNRTEKNDIHEDYLKLREENELNKARADDMQLWFGRAAGLLISCVDSNHENPIQHLKECKKCGKMVKELRAKEHEVFGGQERIEEIHTDLPEGVEIHAVKDIHELAKILGLEGFGEMKEPGDGKNG